MTTAGPAATARRRRNIVFEVAALPPVPRLLVLTQLAFNTGFYLVLPFLADHLAGDLGLAAVVVGLVLGLRTFSQQGFFLLGGVLADRFGTRPVVLAGVAIRVVGFVVLGFADSLAGVLAGTLLTGVAGALFSPAVEAALARQGGELESRGGLRRTELFAMFAAAGKVGAVLGPLLGVALLNIGFRAACLAAAAVFVLILSMHVRWLPREPRAHAADPVLAALAAVTGNRRFLLFAVANSAGLLAYNQLYLALPVELERVGSEAALGWLFALASTLVILAQLPITRLARTAFIGPRALVTGYGLTSLAFAVVAIAAPGVIPGSRTPAPAVAFVVLLTLGQMIAGPVASDVTARLAGERHLGAHFGVLSVAGGVTVLLGSTSAGVLFDLAPPNGPPAAAPWAVLALIPASAAAAMWRLLSDSPPHAPFRYGKKAPDETNGDGSTPGHRDSGRRERMLRTGGRDR